MERRQFLRVAGAVSLAAGGFSGRTVLRAAVSDPTIRIDRPFGGAILHERFGDPVVGTQTASDGRRQLRVRLTGQAPEGREVTVVVGAKRSSDQRKFPARRQGNRFEATVAVDDWKNAVYAYYQDGDRLISADPVRFIWLKNSFPRYRFQIDDNSFFLRDIYREKYQEIFDCFYLAGLRKLHGKYGAKFVLNIFNATPERDFELHMMPDRYRTQWTDNADWLRLSFHAETEFPERPYENDPPNVLEKDYRLVEEEIRRFAGDRVWTPPGIIHYGEVRRTSFAKLHELGVRSLSGYFVKRGGEYPTSFHLPNDVCAYLAENDGWYDFENDIVVDRLEMVVNLTPLPQVTSILERSAANPKTAEMIDLLTHEQYFWPFYANYIPEHFERLDAALRFVSERGYRPVFHSDGFYSVPTDEEILEV